jgi:hypothetical protein
MTSNTLTKILSLLRPTNALALYAVVETLSEDNILKANITTLSKLLDVKTATIVDNKKRLVDLGVIKSDSFDKIELL